MKSVLFVCAILFGGAALAADGTASVINHGQPAQAPTVATTAPAVVAAPAPAASVAIIESPRRVRCANGRCCTGPDCKLYSVDEESHEYVRNRVLGGQVIRRGSRTVVRPVR